MSQLVTFISYSGLDGEDFAVRLSHELRRLPSPVEPSIDLDQAPGYRFQETIQRAIGGCDVLLFVVTRDSVQSEWCQRELGHAMSIGKRILRLQCHGDAGPLLAFDGIRKIDFTSKWALGWEDLRQALALIDSPRARLESLEKQQRILDRQAQRAGDATARQRYEHDRAKLDEKIQEQRRRVDDPEGSSLQVMDTIREGQAREKAGEAAPVGRSGIRFVNEPPRLLPNQFLDRALETQHLQDRLADPAIRLVAVVGRDGIGKTAMVSQLLDGLRNDPARLHVDAFIYLPAHGSRPIRSAILLEDLRKVVPDRKAAGHLAEFLNDSALTLPDKLDEVIRELAGTRVVVVIDNAEELLDSAMQLRDRELDEVVRGLVVRRDHDVKLILVTREAPDPLLRPPTAWRLNLDRGFPPADAYDFLRKLDYRGIFGLRSAPEEHLERVRRLTDGHPRALEALFSTLQIDSDASLLGLLNEMHQLPAGQDMVSWLIGRMFDRLDPDDRRVMQALAVYSRPVQPSAVDYLLQVYLKGYSSEPTLRRLLDERLIRQDGERFYVPASPDGELLLDALPEGQASDRDRDPPPLTRLALLHRAAGYFRSVRKGRVVRIDDLSAEFAEIDLRMRGREYQAALKLIYEIDQEHLTRWGQSDAVAHWREQLRGKLYDPASELHNISWLADARRQQDDQRGAINLLIDAQRQAKTLRNVPHQVRIQVALGSAHFDNGQVTKARAFYEQALAGARRRRMRLEEAKAREGLFLCLGETGEFRLALEEHHDALEILEELDHEESQNLKAELLVNAGWIHGLLSQTEEALESLREGRKLAHRLHEELLEGLALNGEAAALIDDGHSAQAIEPATEAVAIGVRTRSPHLSREANGTLALANLCAGNLDAASDAADAAARYRRSRRALGAFALQGITAFRQDEQDKARLAFLDAHVQAEILRKQESRNFQVLDTHGLVLCGLALCGDHDQFDHAVAAYRVARAVTREPGARRRSRRLLDELVRVDGLARGLHLEELAAVRRAADGR